MHSNVVKELANRLSVNIAQYNRGAGLHLVVSSGAAQHKDTAILPLIPKLTPPRHCVNDKQAFYSLIKVVQVETFAASSIKTRIKHTSLKTKFTSTKILSMVSGFYIYKINKVESISKHKKSHWTLLKSTHNFTKRNQLSTHRSVLSFIKYTTLTLFFSLGNMEFAQADIEQGETMLRCVSLFPP